MGVKYIYLISDPRSDKPLYVGQAKCVLTRIGGHLSTESYNIRLGVVLNELKRLVLFPKVQILEVVPADQANQRERFWVHHYYNLYPDLCNGTLLPTKPKQPKVPGKKGNYKGGVKKADWNKDFDVFQPENFFLDSNLPDA